MNIRCALILLCNHIIVISYSQDIDPDTFDFDNFDAYMMTEIFEYSTLDPLSFFPSVELETELPVEVETEIPSESSESEISSTQKTPVEKQVTTAQPVKVASTDLPKEDISDSQENPDGTNERTTENEAIVTTESGIEREATKSSLPTTTPKNTEDLLPTTTQETVDRTSSTEAERNIITDKTVTTEATNESETTMVSILTTTPRDPEDLLPTTTLETVSTASSTDVLVTTKSSFTTETITTNDSESFITSTEFPTTTMNLNKVETSSPSIEATSSVFDSTIASTTSQIEIETTLLPKLVSTTVPTPQSTSGPISTSIETTSPKFDSTVQNSTSQIEIETTTLQNMVSTTLPTPQSTLGPIDSTIDRGIRTTTLSSITDSSSFAASTSTENPKKSESSTSGLSAINERETTTQRYEGTTRYTGKLTEEIVKESSTARTDSTTINNTNTGIPKPTESVENVSSTESFIISTVPIESTTDPSTTSQLSNSSTIESSTTEYIQATPKLTSSTPQSTTTLSITSSTTQASTLNSIKIESPATTLKTTTTTESFTISSNDYDKPKVTPSTPTTDEEEFPTLDPRLKIPIKDIPESIEITTPTLDANSKTQISESTDLEEATKMPVIVESTVSAQVLTTSKPILTTVNPEISTQLPDVTLSKPSVEASTTKPDESSSTLKNFTSTLVLTSTPFPIEDELPILEPRFKVPIDMIPEPFELTTPKTTPEESDAPIVTSVQSSLDNFDSNVKAIYFESTTKRVEDTNEWIDLDKEAYPTFDPNYMIPIEESEETVELFTKKINFTVQPYPTFNPIFKIALNNSVQPLPVTNQTFGFKLYPFFQNHSNQPKEPVTQPTPVFRFDPKFKKPIEDVEKPVFTPSYHMKVIDPTCGCVRRLMSPTPEPPKLYNPAKEHEHYHPFNPSRIWESNTKPPGSVYRINLPTKDIASKISVDELGNVLKPIPVPAEVLSAFPNFKVQETFEPTKTQRFHKNYLVPNQAAGFHVIPQGEVRIVTPTVQSPIQVVYKYNMGSSSPTVGKLPEQEKPMHFLYKYSPEEGKTKIIIPNADERPLHSEQTFTVTPSRPILNREFRVETGYQPQLKIDGCYYKVQEGPLVMDGDSSFGRLLIAPNRCKRCFYCCLDQRSYNQCSRAKLSECLKRQLVDLPGRSAPQPQIPQKTQTSNSPCKLTKSWPDGATGLPKFRVICS